MQGRYIEPFVGGASVFFYTRPHRALLSDVNFDLIDLYLSLKKYPSLVWEEYLRLPKDKEGYYRVRALDSTQLRPWERAARLLFLNRTCFKGMWRQNKGGGFNVGYGGQSRRWGISEEELLEASTCLNVAELLCSDFESIVHRATSGDFIFADPPYKPGARELVNAHYTAQEFAFNDQQRLAEALKRASLRGVRWVMTNSAHPDILSFYRGFDIRPMAACTGRRPGIVESAAGTEVIVSG
jgi:DNA adenine methylase